MAIVPPPGVTFETNARQIAEKQARRARNLSPNLKKATEQIGKIALATSNALITKEIYSKPEDVSSTGRPKWRRTNKLAALESLTFEDDGFTAVLVNTAEYAEPRHEANKPGRRQINPQRTAHWRDDTIQALRQFVPNLIARTVRETLSETPGGGEAADEAGPGGTDDAPGAEGG